MRFGYLTPLVLEEVGHCPVQDSGAPLSDSCGMAISVDSVTSSFYANESDRFIIHEAAEESNGV